jgi:hypothetical protein
VFAEGTDTLNKKTLTDLVHTSAIFALTVGSDLDEPPDIPPDHTLISSMVHSAWQMTESGHDAMSRSEFHAWCTSHCPRLLDGVIQWIMTSLLLATPTQLEGVGHGAESGETVEESKGILSPQYYRLPSPHLSGEQWTEERKQELQTLIWSLSVNLPLIYLGHREHDGKDSNVRSYITTSLP